MYLDLDYVYVEGKVGVDAASTLLSATGCDFGQGGTNYISDEPKNTLISKPFPILTDGRIINARKFSILALHYTRSCANSHVF